MSRVLAGNYSGKVECALMDTLGVAPVERDVELRDGIAHIDSIALPAASELIRSACKGQPIARDESMVRGTVRDSLGRAVAHAAVTVSFQTDVIKATGSAGADGLTWK